MRKHSRVSVAVLAAALVVGSAAAEAAVITLYGDRTSFTAATETLTTIDFEGIAASGGFLNFTNAAGGLTVDGVNFQTSGTGPFGTGVVSVMGAAYAAGQSAVYNTGTGAILTWTPSNQPGTADLDATLPVGITAVGTDLWAVQPYIPPLGLINVVVTAADNTTETFAIAGLARPTPSFFGVTSDEAITALRFEIPAGQVGVILDNFNIGTAEVDDNGPGTPVPEPSSFALFGAALAGLCRMRRSARA